MLSLFNHEQFYPFEKVKGIDTIEFKQFKSDKFVNMINHNYES